MGLFDHLKQPETQTNAPETRSYEQENQRAQEEEINPYGYSDGAIRDQNALKAFIKSTYQYFAASMLAGATGAYVGMDAAATIQSFYWPLVILEIALIFGLNFVRNKPGINTMVLFAFTFISGLTLTPLLSHIMQLPGGAAIITNAFLMTSVAFGGLSLFAMQTERDFSAMGKMLMITLIVVVVGGIANIFMQSPILQLVIAGVSAILFSAFILYDTQNIVRGLYDSPVSAAASLYLDFLNLFVSLLQILGIMSNSDD
jgi:modulator of FtsH protease